MADSLTLITAFLIGFAGSTHCIGMCGGIVGTLSACLPERAGWSRSGYHLLYSFGRISSYAIAGSVAGLIGDALLSQLAPARARTVGVVVSGTFMILLGLHLSGAWNGLSVLEQQGGRIWQRVAPVTGRLLPIDRPHRALALGLVWGWLPCGLVYSVLVWAAASGSASRGAALMAAFGLGTLPMLMLMGSATTWLERLRRHAGARRLAGGLIVLFGVLTVGGWMTPVPWHHPHNEAVTSGMRTGTLMQTLRAARAAGTARPTLTPLVINRGRPATCRHAERGDRVLCSLQALKRTLTRGACPNTPAITGQRSWRQD